MDDNEYVTGFEKAIETTSVPENILSLFNKFLHKKYAMFSTCKKIEVLELLNWNFWPDIIRIFGKSLLICVMLTIKL